ncbi:MAG: hypothetical protein U5L02_18580 [Rheinheimera sp.]|nr:hypothetical protein [Rheinheimera sp.]
MNEVSKYQIYALRSMYLLVVIGLALSVWPDVFSAEKPFASLGNAQTVQTSMLGAFWLLCILGVRYPLQMLPILMWELVWKTLWLVTVPLPLFLNGTFNDKLMPNVIAIGMVVLVYLVMPWGYVWQHYVKQPGTPWFGQKSAVTK